MSAQNIDCGYSLEPPGRGGSNEYHNLAQFMFLNINSQNFTLPVFRTATYHLSFFPSAMRNWNTLSKSASRKYTYIVLTPFNPTFMY